MSEDKEKSQTTSEAGDQYEELFLEPEEDDVVPTPDVVTEGDEGANSEVEQLRAELAAARAEADDFKQRWMRKAADAENARKRHLKEKSDLQKYGNEQVLKEFVAVLDDLDRAMEHIGGRLEGEPEGELGTLLQGVSMVQRKFRQALEKFECRGFDSVGKPFDPQLHEALQQVEDPSVPVNTVVTEFQKGYMLAERLLRPALVVVSKGGPASTGAAEAVDDDSAAGSSGEPG